MIYLCLIPKTGTPHFYGPYNNERGKGSALNAAIRRMSKQFPSDSLVLLDFNQAHQTVEVQTTGLLGEL